MHSKVGFSITHAGRTIVVRKKAERVCENTDSGKQNKVSSPDCPEVGTGRIEDDLRKCGNQSAKREDVWYATAKLLWGQTIRARLVPILFINATPSLHVQLPFNRIIQGLSKRRAD